MIWSPGAPYEPAITTMAQQPVTAWTDVVTAISLAVLAVVGILACMLFYVVIRNVDRLASRVEAGAERVGPQVKPLLEKADNLLQDSSAVVASLRESTDDIRNTLDGVNAQIKSAANATEDRVRQFGIVLEVAQQETESFILGTTARAKGLQAMAAALRKLRPLRKRAD